MGMKYYKLFDLLARKGLKKTDLLKSKIISSPTLAKLSKGETVTTEILSNICEALECQPGDIMEYIPSTSVPETKPLSQKAEKPLPLSQRSDKPQSLSKRSEKPLSLQELSKRD